MSKVVKSTGNIRIIGGKWRGRLLKVPVHATLRPTPDRVRETLFNWLMHDIHDARCLDLFAGTGALGFEALSRGAKEVVLIENQPLIAKALQSAAQTLHASAACEIITSDAIEWLQTRPADVKSFDIIFLDPPYASDLLSRSLSLLANSALITAQTYIYIEAPQLLSAQELPTAWHCVKQKMAGEVAYHLMVGAKP